MVRYINVEGNICEFSWSQSQEEAFTDSLEFISGTWFEPKELVKVKATEEVEETIEGKEEVTELQKYITLLKEAKVKGAHLIQDVERAKAKCEELNLL